MCNLTRWFRDRHESRTEGEEWFAFVGTLAYHPGAMIFWVGLTQNAPTSILDSLGTMIQAMGFPTERGTAVPDRHGMEPLHYLGDEGPELLRMI